MGFISSWLLLRMWTCPIPNAWKMWLVSEPCVLIVVSLKAVFEKRVWVIFHCWNLSKLGVLLLLTITYSSCHRALGHISHKLGQKIHLSFHSCRNTNFISMNGLYLAFREWSSELEMISTLKMPSTQIVFTFETCVIQ